MAKKSRGAKGMAVSGLGKGVLRKKQRGNAGRKAR